MRMFVGALAVVMAVTPALAAEPSPPLDPGGSAPGPATARDVSVPVAVGAGTLLLAGVLLAAGGGGGDHGSSTTVTSTSSTGH